MNKTGGTLRECLIHFSEQISSLDSLRGDAIRKIASLLSVSYGTFEAWLKGRLPVGENLLALQTMLSCIGYTLSEQKELLPVQLHIGQLAGYGILSVSDIGTHVTADADAVFRWAFGKVVPSHDRQEILKKLIAQHEQEVRNKRQMWLGELAGIGIHSLPLTDQHNVDGAGARSGANYNHDHEYIVASLGHLILAAIPLAQKVLSDDFSEIDRKRLREITRIGHSHGVFDLSNLLNRLCGEKARGKL